MLAVVLGLPSWGVAELTAPDAVIPPQLIGLAFSLGGMLLGSLPRRVR
jgi:hypothetical protein